MSNFYHTTHDDIYHTIASIEDIIHYFQTNKKLKKKITIIQTACHTLIERRKRFWRAGYCLVITDRGATREVDIKLFAPKVAFFSFRQRTFHGLKSFFEMLYAVEDADKQVAEQK